MGFLATDVSVADPMEDVRASDESYRTIFDLAGDAMFVHDIETGAILDANIKACEMHGCSLDELKALGVGGISVGESPYDMPHARHFIQLAATGLPQRFEWQVMHHSGDRLWVEVSLNRARILGSERVIASVRNIDERKKADDMLQAAHDELEKRVQQRTADLECRTRDLELAEQRFRAIVEASPTPLLLSRLEDGRILFANERLEMLLRAEPGSLSGKQTVEFYHDPTERDKVVDLLREHGSVRDLELSIRQVDGTPRWVSASVQYFTYDGEPALATALLDITDRKRAQETLTFQKTLLEAQSDSLMDGMLVVSSDRRILSFNQRFMDIFGLRSDVLEKGSDETALANALDKVQDPNAFLDRIAFLYANPDERARDEVAMVDGRVLDRYSAPVVSKDGHRYGRIWFFRDVTDERRYQRELMVARTEAEAAREEASRYAKSLRKELETGRRIQRGFLPAKLPQPAGYETDVRFKPAWQVAGDFYDMFYAAPGLLGIVVADVC
ncbi:MAG: PAS domain S-box protein, partial [Rhodothermia bacterium]|nr:PAS domain S-box protein [Rhodothermia bacterium]